MIIHTKKDAEYFENSSTCQGVAYGVNNETQDLAVIDVNGRYPENDYLVNEVCDEVAYIVRRQRQNPHARY